MSLRIATISFASAGTDPRAERIARALSDRGDDVVSFAAGGGVSSGGPTLETIGSSAPNGSSLGRARFVAEVTARISRAHLAKPFDVVIAHASKDVLLLAAMIPRVFGAKLIVDLGTGEREAAEAAVVGSLAKGASFVADAVIAASEAQYDRLLRAGLPAYKLHVVTGFIDPRRFPAREKDLKIEKEGTVRVLWHGALERGTGADLALRTIAEARATDPRQTLTLLGGGSMRSELQALAEKLELGPDVVRFEGATQDSARSQAIREAHLGLVLTESHEVLPEALLENVAVGLPTIASRTAAVTHAFYDTGAVQLVPTGDVSAAAEAVHQLTRDPQKRRAMSAAAKAWEAEHGGTKQTELLFRAVDFVCAEKVLAEKRARQAAAQGVKTGTKKTPAKV